MVSTSDFAEIATLAGDPARACMLHALMDGRALTAAELARAAGITAQTASGHLSRLVASGLLRVEPQGRHRYHRLASPAVARMMESIMQVAADRTPPPRPVRTGPRDKALADARTCYDHLAGRLGVALADAMVAGGHVELAEEAGLITARGRDFLVGLGLNLPNTGTARAFCRPCLDWSERRPHLAGALGRALCHHAFDQGWVRRVEGSRAVSVTPAGTMALRRHFAVDLAGF
ncbi:ArsR/SmtB family transcription factor [Niveispirillum sp. KHB5.9]|uniref:ArsR/SmtB family transcription factor n=1 Tax=Niveispirillum sp. KHB5.9 TaxID=3400269 RepID=UPI003A8936F1